jgi:hypothetical protein
MANFVYYLGVRIIRIAGRRINDAMLVNRVYIKRYGTGNGVRIGRYE